MRISDWSSDVCSSDLMKLREEKHWAYGAYSFIPAASGQQPWIGFAPVQIDKTIESLTELKNDITAFATGSAPISVAEADKIRFSNVRDRKSTRLNSSH